MKPKLRSKIIVPHMKDCGALDMVRKGAWDDPWAVPTGNVHYLDLLGRRGGYRRWIEYCCNDTHCAATVVVLENDITNNIVTGDEVKK